jgi:hypothetical protein
MVNKLRNHNTDAEYARARAIKEIGLQAKGKDVPPIFYSSDTAIITYC